MVDGNDSNGSAMTPAIRAHTPAADGVVLRAMEPRDLEAAYGLSMDMHWSHRPSDWSDALALGEGMVAEVDRQVVGTAMRWRWGRRHATVGLVIVSPLFQGRQIGRRLMHAVLDGLDKRTVLLEATPEGRGLYERLGFVRVGEIRQHQGIAMPAPLVALDEGWRLRPYDRSDEKTLVALDARARGWPRRALLRRYLGSAESTMVLDQAGEVRGYAVLRRFGRGLVVGPVVAPDALGAKALIGHLISLGAGRFMRVDIDFDSGLTEWLEELQLLRVGAPTTMVRGPALQSDPDTRLFALATQAMG